MLEKLILGTVQLGTPYGINNSSGVPSEEAAFSILGQALKDGVNALDTAEAYGKSQAVIGSYLHSHPDSLFRIFTKFKFDGRPIRLQLERNILDLGVPSVEGYSYHHFSDLNRDEVRDELCVLKEEGLIQKIGVSIYTNDEFQSAIDASHVDFIQTPFNLLDHWGQRGELINRAKAVGKEVHVRSVFLQGLFYKSPEDLPTTLQSLKPVLKSLLEIAKQHDISIGSLALAYVLQFNEIDRVLIGVETLEQLKTNLQVARAIILDRDLVSQVSALTISEPHLLDPRNWK